MRLFKKTLLVLFILCIFIACHKTHSTSPSAESILPLAIGTNLGYIIQAIEIINGDTQVIRIVYNPNNTIDSVIDQYNCIGCGGKTSAITYFSYSGPYIHIFYSQQDPSDPSHSSAPWLAYRVHLLNNGMCDTLFSYEQTGPAGSSFEYLKYNGTQIDTFFDLYEYNNDHWIVTAANTFTYNSNGDISNSIDQASISNYNYDLTHATQVGDPVMFNQLIFYGIIYTRCAHLTTSANLNATTYTYTFDSKGRVAIVNEVDTQPSDTTHTEYIYQYED